MEGRASYLEVFGHFMEIGGAAAAIIGVNLNFPLNWIVGIAGVFIPILAVYIFDIFKKIKSLFIEKRKVIVNG